MAKSYTIALIPNQKNRYVFTSTLLKLFKNLLSINFRELKKSWQQILLYQNKNSEVALLKLNQISIELIKDDEEFIFQLNDAQLEAICRAKDQDEYDYKLKALKLTELLIDLLQTILPSSKIEKRKNTYNFSYTFIFKTCYYFNNNTIQEYKLPKKHNPVEVVRTVTSLDGDIINQIHKDYLSYYRYADIISSHHWLSNKFVQYLRTPILETSNIIEILLVIPALLISFIFCKDWKTLLLWPIIWGVLGLLWQIIKPWILRQMRGLLWQQLINPKSFLRGRLGKLLFK